MHYTTPLGPLWLHTRQQEITALSWVPSVSMVDNILHARVGEWLTAYFQGCFQSLDTLPPLAPVGTPFQRSVWAAVVKIPLGLFATYGAMAQQLQTSPRAVGNALAANPIPILIPCHRVLAAQGMGGYSGSGGVKSKRFLLMLEGVAVCSSISMPNHCRKASSASGGVEVK